MIFPQGRRGERERDLNLTKEFSISDDETHKEIKQAYSMRKVQRNNDVEFSRITGYVLLRFKNITKS